MLNIPTMIIPITGWGGGGGMPPGTKYATSLSLTIDPSTFVITGQLIDQNGDALGESQIIDLPLESVVVNASYDTVNKMLILTLQNGNTVEVPIDDIISGLQQIAPIIVITPQMLVDSDAPGPYGNPYVTINLNSVDYTVFTDSDLDTIGLDLRQIRSLLNVPTDYAWLRRNATNSQEYQGQTITLYQFTLNYDGFDYSHIVDPTRPYVQLAQLGSAGFIYEPTNHIAWLTYRNFNITEVYSRIYELEVALPASLGVSGSVTIQAGDWSSGIATKTFSALGNYDLIEFYPTTITDKTNASAADIFVSASGTTVTFTATTTPSVAITFNYFITRGKNQ